MVDICQHRAIIKFCFLLSHSVENVVDHLLSAAYEEHALKITQVFEWYYGDMSLKDNQCLPRSEPTKMLKTIARLYTKTADVPLMRLLNYPCYFEAFARKYSVETVRFAARE